MRVQVLGDLEVEVGGTSVDLGGPKPRALLALLVAAQGRAVPVEQLVDQMWGEEPPARVEASLQSYVARLRKALEPDRDPRSPSRTLRTHTGGYSMALGEDDVDARRFAVLLRRAHAESARGAVDPAVELFTEAIGLWRGEPYAGLAAPSLEAEATRLTELRLGAVADLWELRLARGEHGEAAAALEQLVRLHPWRERFWGLLARALYRSARQGDALAALRRAREHLADELGVDPGPELRALEEAVLRQDPALSAAPARREAVAAHSGPDPESRPAAGPALFGRDHALAAADEALRDAEAGRGRLVLVSGEPGVGKTSLGDALVAAAAGRGFRTGRGGWDAEAGLPLEGWRRALSAIAGDDVWGASEVEATDATSVVFAQADAVLGALHEGRPTLLFLDDVHWADAGSLRLLRRVAADLARVPAVLVVSHRDAPAEIGEALSDVLAALARLDPVRLDLRGLDEKAVAGWVAARSGREVAPAAVAEMVQRTDGNPFFLTELVRLLVAEGALDDPGSAAWRRVPVGVRDIVRHRVGALSDEAATLLGVAAVAGRTFDVGVVVAASGLDGAVAEDALEAAQVRGLVDEVAPGRYRFTHALVREAVHESMPAPARARTHLEVAAALEAAHGGRIADHAAELAEHYRLAGPAHARSGWVFARQAGHLAEERAAYDESLRLFTEASALQDRDPTVEPEEREGVLVSRTRALTRVARPVEAWEPAARAARSALARGDGRAAADALLTVTERMVWGWRVHPEWDDEAIALWREVLALQPDDEVLVRAHLTAALAVEHLHRPGSAAESTRLADEAVAAVRRSGRHGARELDVLRLAQTGLLRPNLLFHRMPLADEIVDLATRLDDPSSLAPALTARAQDRAELGRLAEAHSDVVRAQEIAERHHLSQSRMVSGWCLALRRQLDEDLDGAERAIEANEAFQATLAMSGNGIGLCHLAMLRDLQHRLAELEPMLRETRGFHPGIRELHALSMVRAGRLDELRLLLGQWSEQPALTWDYLWLFLSGVRAEVWCALGDQAAVADLYRQLEPYADRLAISVPVGFRGSVRLTLGRLAAAAGDSGTARTHLDRARSVHEELGLSWWTARTDEELTGMGGPSPLRG